jgi:hypothetical protein
VLDGYALRVRLVAGHYFVDMAVVVVVGCSQYLLRDDREFLGFGAYSSLGISLSLIP